MTLRQVDVFGVPLQEKQTSQLGYFAVVDVVAALTDSADAAAYWRKLKQRLKNEGNQTVTDCHAFKMRAA
jgi:hypothetical protein